MAIKKPLESEAQIWWPGAESNHGHGDFQSPALPTELPGHKSERVLQRSWGS